MEEPPIPATVSEPPFGEYSSRCDDKGRIRLPVELLEYLRSLPDQTFFVTTLDGAIGRIYPISTWRANQKTLATHVKDARVAAAIARAADHYGSSAGIDNQGRILTAPDLRRKLGIENQPVYLRYYNDALEFYSQKTLEEALAAAGAAVESTLRDLYAEGLK